VYFVKSLAVVTVICELVDRHGLRSTLEYFANNGVQSVSTKQDSLDDCPHCNVPLEIAAVRFGILKPCRALFVCRACGLACSEDDSRYPKTLLSRAVSRRSGLASSRDLGLWLYGRHCTEPGLFKPMISWGSQVISEQSDKINRQ
jgi:hypothetical protein